MLLPHSGLVRRERGFAVGENWTCGEQRTDYEAAGHSA
jgi:hypothetical protein